MSDPGMGPTAAAARAVLAAMDDEPAKILIVGGIGAGKSTALEIVRRTLRESGHRVASTVPVTGETADVAVIDDAHLLTGPELDRLTEFAERPDISLVVAAEAREHQQGLRTLAAAVGRQGSRVTLGPMSATEVSRQLAAPSGHPPPPEVLTAAMTATAGIPFLVAAAAAAPRPLAAASIDRAAFFGMIERLRRLEQADLEALLIASLSPDLGGADISAALGTGPQSGQELADRIRGTGLAEPSHSPDFRRAVHRAVAQILGAGRHHEIEIALLRTQLESSTLSAALAVELAEHGFQDAGLAGELRRHAAPDDPAERVRITRAAVRAGAQDLRADLSDALARCAECAAAAALTDGLLGSSRPVERTAATRIAASVACHDGNSGQAAELFSWLGPVPDAVVSGAAVIAHLGSGDAAAARAALAAEQTGPPTAAARAARSLAEGLLLTIDHGYPGASARLGQSIAGETRDSAMPDSAPALVTLAALHSGDAARAHSVIGRAIRTGADPALAVRHRLLQGWMRMQEGQLAAAAADADGDEVALHGRDALWTAALRTAIARRGGDTGALHAHWQAGLDALADYSVDLFSLLPVGELWIAAARLGRQDRVAAAVRQGFAVLAELGDPEAWSLPLHWAGVHAGILGNDPAAVAPHAHALAAAAEHNRFAAALAAAGRAWLRVLARQVEAAEVITAARELAEFGLTSDATRLAGQAALQTPDPKVSGQMLQVARDLKLAAGDPSPTATDSSERPAGRREHPASTTLSDREREVAELLLLGMPYRDIGAQLFISAKTVEHHVARIRRRLGAQSRSEMLSMLRAILAPAETNS